MAEVKTAQRPLWHPAGWLAWLGLGLLWLIARLPLRWLLGAGAALGRALAPALRKRLRIARRNLDHCFPERPATERDTLAHAQREELGRMLAEFAVGWMASPAAIARIPVEYVGLEHLAAAQAAGRGVLLVGGHFSHLELAGRLLTQRAPIAGMYREHHDPVFEWGIRRARLRYATAMFRRDELKAVIRHLKAGGILWYAPDQDYLRGHSVYVPFFGQPAATLTATHDLARLSGAVVIGFGHQRLPGGGYRLTLHPPLPDFPSRDATADTTRVNALIETLIRAAPSEYLWVHQRFKRQPPESPSVY
jgi:KDO2-lipid IV(A) lauroyltransferase